MSAKIIDFTEKRREIAIEKLEKSLDELHELSDHEIAYGVLSCGSPANEADREKARPLMCELQARDPHIADLTYKMWCMGITPHQFWELANAEDIAQTTEKLLKESQK